MSDYAHVLLEMKIDDIWTQIGSISEIEPSGSISNEEDDGRQVYMFGWHEGDGPCVWRSLGGSDLANDVIREISTLGLEKLADLKEGPYEMDFYRAAGSMPIRFRESST